MRIRDYWSLFYFFFLLQLLSCSPPCWRLSNSSQSCQTRCNSFVSAAASSTESPKYEWEDWNYYQILGIEETPSIDLQDEATTTKTKKKQKQKNSNASDTNKKNKEEMWNLRNAITTSDVKKAYRKQAQKFHPDKVRNNNQRNAAAKEAEGKTKDMNNKQEDSPKSKDSKKKKASSSSAEAKIDNISSSSPPVNISTEEANARFAKIAEAYQVLSDEIARKQYDQELARHEMIQEELEARRQQWEQRGGSGSMDDFDFYHDVDDFEGSHAFPFSDPMDLFEEFFAAGGGDVFFGGPSALGMGMGAANLGPPHHVSEQTGVAYDPSIGGEVVRRVRKEEWAQGYYRVIAQDFVSSAPTNHRRAGASSYYDDDSYVPITEAMVVEEGYAVGTRPPSMAYGTDGQNRPSQLFEGQILTPRMGPLQSPNGRYMAGLAPNCEFVIVEKLPEDEEDDYDGFPAWAQRQRYGGGGWWEKDASEPLWSSDTFHPGGRCFAMIYQQKLFIFAGDDPDHTEGVMWSNMEDEEELSHEDLGPEVCFLSLDNDGSLAMYKRGGFEDKKNNSSSGTLHKGHKWEKLLSKVLSRVGRKRSSRSGRSRSDVCLWASGIAGCRKSGRRLLAVGRSMQRMVHRIGSFLDFGGEGRQYETVDSFPWR